MKRILTFGIGMAAGAILLYSLLHYHLIHSKQGLHLIPKSKASLAQMYVDIRGFTIADWAQHRELVLALTNSGQEELIGNAATDALRNGLQEWLDQNSAR